MLNVRFSHADGDFICSARQAVALETFTEARKGGFASIKGYVSKTGYVAPKVSDITALTRISVMRLYERCIDALESLTLSDVMEKIPADSRLRTLTVNELETVFNDRRTMEIDSMRKTLAGERDDARRQAHDTFYRFIDVGVKVHLKTEKLAGETVLVRDAATGLPIAESIMLTYIPISENVLTEGVHKVVNSGNPVLMSNAIKACLPKSCKLRTASLKEDNFDSIAIDGNAVIPNDIKGMFT